MDSCAAAAAVQPPHAAQLANAACAQPILRCCIDCLPLLLSPICSHLSELHLGAPWSEVPACIASLPLAKLWLVGFHFQTDTLQQRLAGGFSREFTLLAPTLQVLFQLSVFVAGLMRYLTFTVQLWRLPFIAGDASVQVA